MPCIVRPFPSRQRSSAEQGEADPVGGQPGRVEQGLAIALALVAEEADDAAALATRAQAGGQLQAGDIARRVEIKRAGQAMPEAGVGRLVLEVEIDARKARQGELEQRGVRRRFLRERGVGVMDPGAVAAGQGSGEVGWSMRLSS